MMTAVKILVADELIAINIYIMGSIASTNVHKIMIKLQKKMS